ncbi:MAG: ABC transporter substrate-binding protein [candidate division NC10 bacterium]|nr:ABC transporter substrate-binding protein [candidate division NC10 bacterium]
MNQRGTRTRRIGRAAGLCLVALAGIGLPAAVGWAGEQPVRGGTLRIGLYSDPNTLNCMESAGDPVQQNIITGIFDSLVVVDYKDSTVHPGLATKWKPLDDKTWLVTLRKGVQFHKGYGEMTAEDAAFTMNYIVKNKTNAYTYVTFVDKAEVVDRYTVKYTLTAPFAPFLVTSLFYGSGMVVSKKAFEERGFKAFNRDPVGTGPFEFVEWSPAAQIILKRFDKYWDRGKPYLDRIHYRIVPDAFVRLNMLKNGEIDMFTHPDFKDLKALQEDPRLVVASRAGHNFDFIAFNLKRKPFDNKKVRQAIAWAIDRKEIVDNVYYGHATITDDPMPPGMLADNPARRHFLDTADVAKAKQLLVEAGYGNGFTTTYITSPKEQLRRLQVIVAAQLQKIGVTVQLQSLDSGTFASRYWREKNFDMATRDLNIVSPDPDSTVYWFHHTKTIGNNGYESPEVDRLLDTARGLSDPASRVPMYQKVLDSVYEDVPYIYIAHVNMAVVYNKILKNFALLPNERKYFQAIWLGKP